MRVTPGRVQVALPLHLQTGYRRWERVWDGTVFVVSGFIRETTDVLRMDKVRLRNAIIS